MGHLPVTDLLTWDEINSISGPVMVMAARGCVPKQWRDIAHMLGRWNDKADPAGCARAWFRDNPTQRAALDELFATGRIRNPFTGVETKFRRESLGRVGKNHRYVWVAEGLTADDAQAMLDRIAPDE